MEGNTKHLTVMYDIACVLEAHLKKNSRIDLARVNFVLPIFHSYGHKMSCQLTYGPRKVKGVGLTDGETMERLWSYLRKFSTITKQMTAQRRVDLLNDALLHYASKLRKKLGKHFQQKLKKLEITERDSKQQLDVLMKEQKEPVNLATVEQWQSEEKTACQVADGSMTARDKYLLALYDLYRKQSSAVELNQEENTNPEVLRLAEKVHRFQHDGHEVMVNDSEEYKQALSSAVDSHRRTHISKLRAVAAERRSSLMQLHAARGQEVAKKISKTVAKLNKKMKLLITNYNNYGDVNSTLPATLSFKDVSSENSQVFSNLPGISDIQRKLLYIKDIAARCKEEKDLLTREAATASHFYQKKIALCQQFLAGQQPTAGNIDSECSQYSTGLRALLYQQIFIYEQRLAELQLSSTSAFIQPEEPFPLMDTELLEISSLEQDEFVSMVEDGLEEDDEVEDEEGECDENSDRYS